MCEEESGALRGDGVRRKESVAQRLTERHLRQDAMVVPFVVALANHDRSEQVELEPAASALLERGASMLLSRCERRVRRGQHGGQNNEQRPTPKRTHHSAYLPLFNHTIYIQAGDHRFDADVDQRFDGQVRSGDQARHAVRVTRLWEAAVQVLDADLDSIHGDGGVVEVDRDLLLVVVVPLGGEHVSEEAGRREGSRKVSGVRVQQTPLLPPRTLTGPESGGGNSSPWMNRQPP